MNKTVYRTTNYQHRSTLIGYLGSLLVFGMVLLLPLQTATALGDFGDDFGGWDGPSEPGNFGDPQDAYNDAHSNNPGDVSITVSGNYNLAGDFQGYSASVVDSSGNTETILTGNRTRQPALLWNPTCQPHGWSPCRLNWGGHSCTLTLNPSEIYQGDTATIQLSGMDQWHNRSWTRATILRRDSSTNVVDRIFTIFRNNNPRDAFARELAPGRYQYKARHDDTEPMYDGESNVIGTITYRTECVATLTVRERPEPNLVLRDTNLDPGHVFVGNSVNFNAARVRNAGALASNPYRLRHSLRNASDGSFVQGTNKIFDPEPGLSPGQTSRWYPFTHTFNDAGRFYIRTAIENPGTVARHSQTRTPQTVNGPTFQVFDTPIPRLRIITVESGVITEWPLSATTITIPSSATIDSIRWSAQNATACTAVAGPGFSTGPGSPTSGTDSSITTPAVGTQSTFTVRCTNPVASAERSVIVRREAPTPAATLTVSSCTIPPGATTCTSAMTWNITNATNPNLRNATRGVTYTTAATGTNQPFAITHGTNRIQARNGSTVLLERQVTASCAAGTTWDGTRCLAALPTVTLQRQQPNGSWVNVTNNGTITLRANPLDTTELRFRSLSNSQVSHTCTVRRDGAVIQTTTGSGTLHTPSLTGFVEPKPVPNATTTLMVRCTNSVPNANPVTRTVFVHTQSAPDIRPALTPGTATNPNPMTGTWVQPLLYRFDNLGGVILSGPTYAIPYRILWRQNGTGVWQELLNDSFSGGLAPSGSTDSLSFSNQLPYGIHSLAIGANTNEAGGVVNSQIGELNFANNFIQIDDIVITAPPPHLSMQAEVNNRPVNTVRFDTPATLVINIGANYEMNCELVGPGIGGVYQITHTGSSENVTYSIQTGQLRSQSDYALTCEGPVGAPIAVQTSTTITQSVSVVPLVQEL